jgi:hypothetical protein
MSARATPLGPARKPFRNDPRGWQIEDDATAEALLEAAEAAGLIFLELVLHRLSRLSLEPGDHDLDLALRGLGTLAGRVGMSRLSWLTGIDELGRARQDKAGTPEAEAVGEAMRRVLQWLLVWDPLDPDAPPELAPPSSPRPIVRLDLAELHAAATYLDRRARDQGTSGPGRRRSMVRTTTRRRS